MNNRGSEWSKWDLHIHTPKTWLCNNYNNDEQAFIDEIVNAGITAVGLTNYFKFNDGEIEGENSIKSKLEGRGVTVFPNLEFRLDQGNHDGEAINIHILFSNKIEPGKISGFLGRLRTLDGHYCQGLSQTEIECAVVGKDTMFETLEKETDMIAMQDYIVIGCPNGYGGFRPNGQNGRSTAVAVELDRKSHGFFASAQNPDRDQDFFLTNRGHNLPPKPVFLCSDAHCIDDIGKKFTWIKARTTFEGLLQTLYSPKSRVKFHANPPADYKSKNMIIDKIVYGQDGSSAVELNPDLVSIIGARGNGKSILLKAIAIKISENEYKARLGEERLNSDAAWLNKHFPHLKIVWKDGAIDAGNADNPKKVFFIHQGYLSNLSYDENDKEKERNDFLITLLRKNEEFNNAESQAKTFLRDNMLHISKNVSEIISNKEDLERLTEENNGIGGRKSIENEIAELKARIEGIASHDGITEQEKEQYFEADKSKETQTATLKVVEQDITILNNLLSNTAIIRLDDYVLDGLSLGLKDDICAEFEKYGENAARQIIQGQLKSLNKKKLDIQAELKSADDILIKLKPKFDQQKELQILMKKESKLASDLEKISRNQYRIQCKHKAIQQMLEDIKTRYFNSEKQQKEIFKTVNFGDFKFIDVDIEINKSSKHSTTFVEQYVNRTKIKDVSGATKKFIQDEKHEITEKNILPILSDLIDRKITLLKSVQDEKQAISQLLANPYGIDFLDSIKIKESGTLFRNMTGGQKAMTLLELVFKFDKNRYPILLDQPEDDLDASGIANNIVEFVLSQKSERQILIVSHSANLVVCADSEEIITAEYQNGKFSYKSGAIEDPRIKQQIVDILEGGETALLQRMNKLLMKQLLV